MKTNLQTKRHSYGYYCVEMCLENGLPIISTNNERAFIISQLQDLLSPRLLINEVPAHKQLASCLDLLGFSITKKSVQLLLFSIDSAIVQYFTNCVASRLAQYKSELKASLVSQPARVSIIRLDGPHDALNWSLKIHLAHEDWEYDRYSSIGFYLHDRRGDWMRTWRLSQLYENDPANYFNLIQKKLEQNYLSLSHGGVGHGRS